MARLLSKEAAPFSAPTCGWECSAFPTSSPAPVTDFLIFAIFVDAELQLRAVWCVRDWKLMIASSHERFTICRYFFREISIHSPCLFLNSVVCLYYGVVKFLNLSYIEVPYEIYDFLIYLPTPWITFSFS